MWIARHGGFRRRGFGRAGGVWCSADFPFSDRETFGDFLGLF
jgi:hypothetical protein